MNYNTVSLEDIDCEQCGYDLRAEQGEPRLWTVIQVVCEICGANNEIRVTESNPDRPEDGQACVVGWSCRHEYDCAEGCNECKLARHI